MVPNVHVYKVYTLSWYTQASDNTVSCLLFSLWMAAYQPDGIHLDGI